MRTASSVLIQDPSFLRTTLDKFRLSLEHPTANSFGCFLTAIPLRHSGVGSLNAQRCKILQPRNPTRISRRTFLNLVVEPLIRRLHLFLGIGWEQVIDSDVGRGYQDRLGVREGIVSVFRPFSFRYFQNLTRSRTTSLQAKFFTS